MSKVQQLETELQEKVSFTMVKSMIGEMNPAQRSFQNKLSNSNVAASVEVPGVDVEESLGKATEDFGGYDLDDDKSGGNGPKRLGYEHVEDSAGIEKSALKQFASLNINEAATPIHISQNSVIPENEAAQAQQQRSLSPTPAASNFQ